MMTVRIRRLQFQSGQLPSDVRITIADAGTKKESEVWISAKFFLGKRSSDRLPMLALEAIDEMQRLIDEARKEATREPGS